MGRRQGLLPVGSRHNAGGARALKAQGGRAGICWGRMEGARGRRANVQY